MCSIQQKEFIDLCMKGEYLLEDIDDFIDDECSDISDKELKAFKTLAKVLLSLSDKELDIAIQNGNFTELK